jgi:uncharacterized protein
VKPLVVGVADLLRHPGARRHDRLTARLPGLHVLTSQVPADADVTVDVVLEAVSDSIVAAGDVRAGWIGECTRCLRPVGGTLEASFRELFERHPTDEETYPLGHDTIDLEPLVRDALLLSLPLAPLCTPGCEGLCPTCGSDRNEQACECGPPGPDPRWAALDVLRGDEGRGA